MKTLDMDGGSALFEGRIKGLVAACYVNERPLQGLAGWLDWRFQGLLSGYLRTGIITGSAGECVYVPIRRNEQVYHLILAGGGSTSSPGHRKKLPKETWKNLHKNFATLKLDGLAVSRSDLGEDDADALNESLKGAPVWIVN